jgi:hypothetical protein
MDRLLPKKTTPMLWPILVKEDSGVLLNKLRQKDQVRRKSTEEQNHHVSIIGAHHTKYNGFEGRSDIVAPKLLSEYAYNNFFLVSLKRSSHLQQSNLEDGAVVVWQSNVTNPHLTDD